MKLYSQSGKLTISMDLPHFDYEKQALENGFDYVGGVDEVGRGCLAGPVVAACVVFDSEFIRGQKLVKTLIRDSKKMSAKQREKSAEWIKNNCLSFGIGEASVGKINKHGIKKAADSAIRKAIQISSQKCQIGYLLTDAFYIPKVKGLPVTNQKAIIKGDNQSVSIAAASILAKVYRDSVMEQICRGKYFCYRWDLNKGYGTQFHQKAILEHGPTGLHRHLFVRNLMKD